MKLFLSQFAYARESGLYTWFDEYIGFLEAKGKNLRSKQNGNEAKKQKESEHEKKMKEKGTKNLQKGVTKGNFFFKK